MPIRFDIIIDAIPSNIFSIWRLKTQHWAISQLPEFHVDILIPTYFDPTHLQGRFAQGYLQNETQRHLRFSGKITAWRTGQPFLKDRKPHQSLSLIIKPWLYDLGKKRHSRVFVDQSPEAVTARIFTENGVLSNAWYWHSPKISAISFPLLLQIQETDLDFLKRLWAKQGYAFAFEFRTEETLCHIAKLTELRKLLAGKAILEREKVLEYHAPKGMNRAVDTIFDWTYIQKNDKSPEMRLRTLSQDIQLGQIITPNNLNHPDLPHQYYVIGIDAQYQVQSQSNELGYEQTLHLLPVDAPFQPEITKIPSYPGLWSATIESKLDTQGQYYLRFDFDQQTVPVFPPSPRIAFAQPHKGADYGIHWPLKTGTPVAVTIRNTPQGGHEVTIIGTRPNTQEYPVPVSKQNPSLHCFRTQAENTFEVDDHHHRHYSALYTADMKQELRLVDNPREQGIRLRARTGQITLQAQGKMMFQTQDIFQIRIRADWCCQIQGHYQLQTPKDIQLKAKDIDIQTQGETRWYCATECRIASSNQLSLTAQETLGFENEKTAHFQTKQGILTSQTLRLEAMNGPLSLQQGHQQIDLRTDGTLILKAFRLKFQAPTIRIKALSINQ